MKFISLLALSSLVLASPQYNAPQPTAAIIVAPAVPVTPTTVCTKGITKIDIQSATPILDPIIVPSVVAQPTIIPAKDKSITAPTVAKKNCPLKATSVVPPLAETAAASSIPTVGDNVPVAYNEKSSGMIVSIGSGIIGAIVLNLI